MNGNPAIAPAVGLNATGSSRSLVKRRAAIQRYDILDTLKEPDFDNIAILASTTLNTAFSAITFIDEHRQWFKAEFGLGIRETPIAHSICAHAIMQDDVFVVPDATRDPRFAALPFVTGHPHVRFYAGMPIRAADGTPIGALCVIDPAARPDGLPEAQHLTLKILVSQIQTQLELRRAIIERDAWEAQQQELSRELRFVADHDMLTGLPNRAVFQACLTAALERGAARGSRTAMMLIDVDHFKQVNDSLGHDAGDALLRSFAARLRGNLRAGDTVARLGGDEFGVILEGIGAEETLDTVIGSMTARLREPIRHEGRLIDCRASIGIAIHPDHAATGASLAKCSDLALAAAKSQRNCVIRFREELAHDFRRETEMLGVARAAIERREILPYYQPQIDLVTGELRGIEALARWRRNGRITAHPEMLAQAFANRELAAALSEQIIAQVLDDIVAWIAAGVSFGRVAINSCAADFVGNDFAERLLGKLEARSLDPRLIELEVTEGVFLGRGAHHVARALTILSAHGVRVALDDFGTGYASLTHLKQFPVDVIKIDKSFVAGIGRNADDAAIVRTLIGLGESLGIETVAEGIETVEQAAFVRAHRCTVGQGFLYGAACPASDVPALAQPAARTDAA